MNTRNLGPVWLLAALPALLLQACSGILTSEQAARQYYLLVPYEGSAAAASVAPKDIRVAVTAVPGLDTDHILALGTDARLNRYSNARWPDHLPEVLTSVLGRSLETSGRYTTPDATAAGGDEWRLNLEVRQFYGRQDAAGETRSVIVELAGSLSCREEGHPVRLTASSAVGAQRLAAVVAAHQASLDSITRDLMELLKRHCES